jgi:CMP/dCMP kinase
VISRVVTIGGPPGSGKSTTARLVAAELGLELHAAGSVFRAEAARRGLSVEEFGHYALLHPEVDRELDRTMQALARPGALLEGRIQGALCRRAGIPVYTVAVTAREEVRARRVAQRDHQSVDEATARVREREASERNRYLRFYGIDLDRDPPDLSVDSSDRPPIEVAGAVTAFLRAHDRAGSGP